MLGRRAVFCVDRAQSTAGKRLRGYHRLRTRLPLRRIRHAARASDRSCFMTFETDSKRASKQMRAKAKSEGADLTTRKSPHRGTRGLRRRAGRLAPSPSPEAHLVALGFSVRGP